MPSDVGELVKKAVKRTTRKGDRVKCETRPLCYVKTKGDDEFELVKDVTTLRLLLTRFVRFSPNKRLTIRVDIERISWQEPEGRIGAEKNSFTIDVDERGRAFLLHKTMPFTETWEDNPSRVDATAERSGKQVFNAIGAVLKRVRDDNG